MIFQLAGTASPSACRRALTPNGTLVLSSGEGRLTRIDRVARALVSSPSVPQRLRGFLTKETTADLVTLAELVEAGKLTPVIDRADPLGEVAEAVSYLEEDRLAERSSSRCVVVASAVKILVDLAPFPIGPNSPPIPRSAMPAMATPMPVPSMGQ
ncbi:MAG: zinc-binding dehydrogenase [Gaiellaceae bacterium]